MTGGSSSSGNDGGISNSGMNKKFQMSETTTGMGMNGKSTRATSGGMKSEMNNDQMMMNVGIVSSSNVHYINQLYLLY